MIQTPLAGPGQTDSVAEQRVQAELWFNMLKGTQEAQMTIPTATDAMNVW